MNEDDDFEDWLIAREECVMDLDDEELKATRKLNGVDKESNIEEDKDVITLKNFIEFFNERKTKGNIATIDVLGEEIYSLEHILEERETDKKRIKELEVLEDDLKDKRVVYIDTPEFAENYIPKQKIKDLLTEIQEEYNKVQEQFDCIWNKKSKDDYDRYKLQEFSTMQQQLGFFIGKLEELLEDK